jgi:uncharacterized protein
MSVLFVAHGGRATLLGHNELIVHAVGRRPFVYAGAIGPVPMPPRAAAEIDEAVQSLAAAFALQGLCSLDFLLDGSRFAVLEVNPRPSASMAAYVSTMRSHVQACLHGVLPAPPEPGTPSGTRIVFARDALRVSLAHSRLLASLPFTHDLPPAGAVFAAGDPVCSVSASGCDARAVRRHLDRRHGALLHHLESSDERISLAHL